MLKSIYYLSIIYNLTEKLLLVTYLEKRKPINLVVPDIRPFLISSRIPDIETIRPDIRQFNLLYLTKKITLNKQTKS